MSLQLPPAETTRGGLLRRVLRPRPTASPGQRIEVVDQDGRIRVQHARRRPERMTAAPAGPGSDPRV